MLEEASADLKEQSTNLLDLLGDMIPPNTSSRADTLELESVIIGARAAPCTHRTHVSDRPMTYQRARASEAHQQTPATRNTTRSPRMQG